LQRLPAGADKSAYFECTQMNPDIPSQHFDSRAFRAALSAFATGVTVVTTRFQAEQDIGITANSFNSVSLDPPLILWSLSRKAMSLAAFIGSEHFAVHVLAADQDALSHRFATQGADKFAGLPLGRGASGVPLFDDCSARFECRKAFTYDGGDHMIFIGEVLRFQDFQRPPLIFHAGRYALAVEKPPRIDTPTGDAGEPDSSFSRDFLIYLLGRARFQMMHGLRPVLDQHAINEDEWLLLSLLGVSDHRRIAELDRVLWYTGTRVTYERVARLASVGLVSLVGGHDPDACVNLSDRGRTIVLEFVAAAKALEARAERNLGFGETQLLKNLLRKVIRETEPGLPPLQTPPLSLEE
jgi:3-hydroxy-9,10-secoandrosta-1,3,5(10)-triene-9,17-dione monooxygenase reductase component